MKYSEVVIEVAPRCLLRREQAALRVGAPHLFTLMENQMADVPGVKQAKAAMAMMPDLTKMQNVVSAMQGVMSSGGSAFESMQKVMGDFARLSGGRR
jgi:hypothetical protein